MSMTEQPPKPAIDLLIITHAILSGAAILVPIPFVDDFIVAAIRQNQVRMLAKQHGLSVSPAEVRLLAGVDSDGCWQGLLAVLKYPFKIVRQFVKILEVKKSVEAATHTYYSGLLLNEVMRNGWYQRERFGMIHQAIQHVKRDANQELVKEIFRSALIVNQENFTLLTGWGRQTLSYLVASSQFRIKGLFWRIRLIRKTVQESPESLFERQPPQITALAQQIYANLNEQLLGKPQAQRQEMFERLAIALRPDESPLAGPPSG